MSVIQTSPSLNNPSRAADWCNHWIKSGDATLNGRLPMIWSGLDESLGSSGARACNDDETSSALPWMIWKVDCVKKKGWYLIMGYHLLGAFLRMLRPIAIYRERTCQQWSFFILCYWLTVNVGKNRSSFSMAAIRLTPVSNMDLVSNPGPIEHVYTSISTHDMLSVVSYQVLLQLPKVFAVTIERYARSCL